LSDLIGLPSIRHPKIGNFSTIVICPGTLARMMNIEREEEKPSQELNALFELFL
jgi:hypothetical protein